MPGTGRLHRGTIARRRLVGARGRVVRGTTGLEGRRVMGM